MRVRGSTIARIVPTSSPQTNDHPAGAEDAGESGRTDAAWEQRSLVHSVHLAATLLGLGVPSSRAS